jgi:hypothetical protein
MFYVLLHPFLTENAAAQIVALVQSWPEIVRLAETATPKQERLI